MCVYVCMCVCMYVCVYAHQHVATMSDQHWEHWEERILVLVCIRIPHAEHLYIK